MLIDCHVHAYYKKEIKKLLLNMKEADVDKAIIMHWPHIGKDKIPTLKEVIQNIKKYPNLCIAGSIRVTDKNNYQKQLRELNSLLKNKQIVGIKLYLGYEHFYANDSRCDKIYKLALKYNAPVIFHTGDTWNLNNAIIRYANPLYIDDVAVKYPELKILISHMGNPWTREAALVVGKNKNVYTDFSGTLSYKGENYSTEEDNNIKKRLLELVSWCGNPRKLLFGSDYGVPSYTSKRYLDFLNKLGFSKKDLEYIKYKNAKKLFGI